MVDAYSRTAQRGREQASERPRAASRRGRMACRMFCEARRRSRVPRIRTPQHIEHAMLTALTETVGDRTRPTSGLRLRESGPAPCACGDRTRPTAPEPVSVPPGHESRGNC
eukprot:7341949-Prymnesium_polylepis.1